MSNATVADIQIQLELLAETWTDFNHVQTQIECACLDEELEAQQMEQGEFESKFCLVKANLMNTLASKSGTGTRQESEPGNVSQQVRMDGQASVNIKLPAIKVPSFSSEYQHWASFSDLFKSVIHNNTSLSPGKKLHYLKGALKGDAARVLSSITITDANYPEARRILNDRFANRSQIIQSHLKALYGQPCVLHETPKDIRRLLDNTIEHVRALHVLNLPTDHWNYLITFFVTERLDVNTRKQWELSITDEVDPHSIR